MVRGYLRRARFYRGAGPAECLVRGAWLRLDSQTADVDKPIREDARRRLAYPPCPDCGDDLGRSEAGEVDHKRSCPGCGSVFECVWYRP